ncbi:restriction endonuclease [Inquilinus sp. NPDC058860]|uniref:restriction endonuclease n=1 Tax=Inquilinus sp. NPDC058860 TaxID=3346652 RepID=UPI0036AF3D84
MAIPDYQTLMLPVLRHAALGETRVPDLEDRIADEFGLAAEERDQLLPSGRQKILSNRIHWAKFYMGKAGLIDSPRRGRFVASEAGRALLARNPERIDVELLQQYPSFRDFYRGGAEAGAEAGLTPEASLAVSEPTATTTPEEQIEAAHLALQAALRDELLQRILQNSRSFFEQVIVDLLVAMGYGGSHRNAATRLGRSGDGGIDGEINEDRLGLDRIYVQAKRYAEGITVGRPDVQAFVGSLVGRGATKGVFVTTSGFSQQAKDFVQHLSQRVILIDGQRLADLMIEHDVGVRVSRAIEFKRLDEDFFTEDE